MFLKFSVSLSVFVPVNICKLTAFILKIGAADHHLDFFLTIFFINDIIKVINILLQSRHPAELEMDNCSTSYLELITNTPMTSTPMKQKQSTSIDYAPPPLLSAKQSTSIDYSPLPVLSAKNL